MTLDREHLGELADALIPAKSGMPAASEAGAVGEWLAGVLPARPDLEAPLAGAHQRGPGTFGARGNYDPWHG